MVLPCKHADSEIRVDFIFSFSPYEQQALKRVRKVRMGKADVRFASVEDLIVHKMFAGRPRDLEDVKIVLEKNPEADVSYIRRWLEEFTQALGEPYLDQFDALCADVTTDS
jgi:predicted nucleotidyltransferase